MGIKKRHLSLKQAHNKLCKAIDQAGKKRHDLAYWTAHLAGLEEAQGIFDQVKEPDKNPDKTWFEKAMSGVRWSIAIPAWSCPSVYTNKDVKPHGLQCLNSHIGSYPAFQYPYPCSKETCPMLLSKPNLGNARYYRKKWTNKGVPTEGAAE